MNAIVPPCAVLWRKENWSQVRLYDGVFAVGKGGTKLRAAWIKRVRDQVRQATAREMDRGCIAKDFDVAKFWSRLRERNGATRFRPMQISTRSANYRASRRR